MTVMAGLLSPTVLFALLWPAIRPVGAQVPRFVECAPDDFNFHYTECDERGERWRYALPKKHRLHCINAPAPVSGLNCSFSCPAGTHLDMDRQECRLCPPGTFSLGDGVRYEQLYRLPLGFSVENFLDESRQTGMGGAGEDDRGGGGGCPTRAGWVVEAGELRYLPTPCTSRLIIDVNLVHDGYVQLHYRMPKNSKGLISILQVRDAHCQSHGIPSTSGLYSHPKESSADTPEVEADGNYRSRHLPVRRGQNRVTWTVVSNQETTSLADVIHLPVVDIYGLAFTVACSPCPVGMFSGEEGARRCSRCEPNHYSRRGSVECVKCPPGQYSLGKGAKCERRPRCDQAVDYYPHMNRKCDRNASGNGWTRAVSQERVKPEICETSADTARPQTPSSMACAKCNAGYKRDSGTGECAPCPVSEFSPDGLLCSRCANNTKPDRGLYLSVWDEWPSSVHASCEYISEEDGTPDCDLSPSWVLRGDRVESSQSRALGVAFEMSVEVPHGFDAPLRWGGMDAKATAENPIAEIRVDMDMECKEESCQFYLIQDLPSNSTSAPQSQPYRLLHAMNGSQARHGFSAPILSSSPTRFTLIFMRSGAGLGRDALFDRAVIHSINVSNVKVGGAAGSCLPCPLRGPNGECKPCPLGHYVEEGGVGCAPCPAGHALNMSSTHRVGPSSCVPCPEHMSSSAEDGSCRFTGRFELHSSLLNQSGSTMHFDLSPLRHLELRADGVKIFGGRTGSFYYHSFNVSLFADRPGRCEDSVEDGIDGWVGKGKRSDEGEGNANGHEGALFCRSAAIPYTQDGSRDGNDSSQKPLLYVSSTVIGRKLAAISLDRTYKQHFHLSNDQLEYESSLAAHLPTSARRPLDVHFWYESVETSHLSSQCPHGLIGVLTARCVADAQSAPIVRLSRRCPDGTCDGCLHHVLVESAHACPICHPDDFELIRGECIDGMQRVHSIPSKQCVLSGAESHERMDACTDLSGRMRLILLTAALFITLLVFVIVVIYRRNRRLEYRYMRIVEGKETALNSCALESSGSDEDDEENFEASAAPRGDKRIDISVTKVYFAKAASKLSPNDGEGTSEKHELESVGGKKRTAGRKGRGATGARTNPEEEREFLSDSSD